MHQPSPIALLVATLSVSMGGCNTCREGGACAVDDGVFYAVPPLGWDGETPLPVLVHFHGYGGSPQQYIDDPAVRETLDRKGVLLVVPEGMDATWSIDHMGLKDSHRDEVAFVDQVLEKTRQTFPVDDSRVYVSGFSLGASLVYTLACQRADVFAAAAPMSGGFWLPIPAQCAGPEIPLCHIHGRNDITWPFEGGRVLQQGDEEGTHAAVEDDVAFWREHNACGDSSVERQTDVLTCQVWDDCAGESEVGLCTHDGGHERFDGWAERELEWMLRFSR